jgi:hypothetical protein
LPLSALADCRQPVLDMEEVTAAEGMPVTPWEVTPWVDIHGRTRSRLTADVTWPSFADLNFFRLLLFGGLLYSHELSVLLVTFGPRHCATELRLDLRTLLHRTLARVVSDRLIHRHFASPNACWIRAIPQGPAWYRYSFALSRDCLFMAYPFAYLNPRRSAVAGQFSAFLCS